MICIVKDRKSATLLEFTRKNCEMDSYITTDEWVGYKLVHEDGFVHSMVNYSSWFVNPRNGAHKQVIERIWVEEKTILKKNRRPTHCMQSHLDELSWKRRHRNNSDSTLISCFWRDVQLFHDLTNLQ